MTLEILICTINKGIFNIHKILLPPVTDISYLISWQTDEANPEIPSGLIRDDVRITTINGKGLSRNRNNAIDHAKGDICLIADDDVRYKADGLQKILDTFSENKTLDIAVFKYGSLSGNKNYPGDSFNLIKMPRGYYISSIEIAFRRLSITGKIRFNELFGIGAPVLSAGEESIFIYDALKNNFNCFYFPIEIVTHNSQSTGKRDKTPAFLMSQGANARYWYPLTCYPRMIKLACKISISEKKGLFSTLKYLTAGITYANKIKRQRIG